MATTFDRETLLDLVVNVIPLVIILFFVVAFAVVEPFGGNRLGRILQYVLLLAPFLALAVLTYVSGKVIATDERRAAVYHQGQATLDDAEPKHGHGGEPDAHGDKASDQGSAESSDSADDSAAVTGDDDHAVSESEQTTSGVDDE